MRNCLMHCDITTGNTMPGSRVDGLVRPAIALTDTGHVTITVVDVNDAPLATDDLANTNEDTALTVTAAMALMDGESATATIAATMKPAAPRASCRSSWSTPASARRPTPHRRTAAA